MSHIVKLFKDIDNELVYIHHNTAHPTDDTPGKHLILPPGQTVKFVCKQSDFSVAFETWPFKSEPLPQLTGRRGQVVKAGVLKDVRSRTRFKYTARVGRVTDDPEVIIDPTC
jgi:hypothetical protein